MADHQKPRVLVVDDDEDLLHGVVRSLRNDFDLATATSADEGIAILERQEFDVIVSDFMMPGGDGVTFLKAARVLFPNVRRILHTGTAPHGVSEYLEDGTVERLVLKPASREEIVEAIDALLVVVGEQRNRKPG